MAWLLRVTAAALALTLVIAAAEVRSQMNPLRELELTAQDIELLGAAADRVYDAGEIGASEAWSNPASGNSGAARLLETFERDGLPCRRIEHVVNIRRDAVPKRLVLATCRTADGRWLLV
jgi:surface antigen